MNKVQGTIKKVGAVMQITEKFKKVEMILETEDTYPQMLCVEWPNDSVSKALQFSEGDVVEIDINIRGREWTNPKDGEVRYFTSLTGWKISSISGGPVSQSGIPSQALEENANDDDLPF
jgi:hypothetical protein